MPTLLFAVLAGCAAPLSDSSSSLSLDDSFTKAATENEVPRDLLVALSYSLTRFDERGGEPSIDGRFGVMDLIGGDTEGPSLDRAADRLGVEPTALMRDSTLNIEGAAVELRAEGDAWERETGLELETIGDWIEIVGWYSGSDDGGARLSFARQVYGVVENGLEAEAPDGELLLVQPHELDIPQLELAFRGSGLSDYPGTANFVAAHSSNYTNMSRTSYDIDSIVVHTAQGSYSGTYNWFANSASNVSAHYVVRSSDGEVTQMVWEEDKGWHAGHSSTNSTSVGIELEGYIDAPSTWYTDAMYNSLAALISDIADRQNIPLDRSHIIGHNEVPGCSYSGGGGAGCHTDPGTGFDWDKLMSLVTGTPGGGSGGGSGGGTTAPGSGPADLIGFVREGSIYDSTAGVAGATVSLSDGSVTLADADGLYRFEGLATGTYDLTVSATGYDTFADYTELASGTNWGSVAVTSSGSSSPPGGSTSGEPSVPWSADPTGWETVYGESVTMSWDGDGDRYEVMIYWYDGSDWNHYYSYSTSSESKTFWPAVNNTSYAWSVRGINSSGTGEYMDLQYFQFQR